MIGFGIVIPVVPFFTERLLLAEGVPAKNIPLHVGLLTGAYALMQSLLAPLWGRLIRSLLTVERWTCSWQLSTFRYSLESGESLIWPADRLDGAVWRNA